MTRQKLFAIRLEKVVIPLLDGYPDIIIDIYLILKNGYSEDSAEVAALKDELEALAKKTKDESIIEAYFAIYKENIDLSMAVIDTILKLRP